MRKVLYILGELDDGDLQWLVTAGRRREVASGHEIIRIGQPIDALYFVVDGVLDAMVPGARKPVNTLYTGEVVGELSFLDARPPAATVVARGPATVYEIPRSRLSARLVADPGFAGRFYRALGVFLAHKLRKATSRLGFGDEVFEDDPDALDDEALEAASLASTRFEWMLSQMRQR